MTVSRRKISRMYTHFFQKIMKILFSPFHSAASPWLRKVNKYKLSISREIRWNIKYTTSLHLSTFCYFRYRDQPRTDRPIARNTSAWNRYRRALGKNLEIRAKKRGNKSVVEKSRGIRNSRYLNLWTISSSFSLFLSFLGMIDGNVIVNHVVLITQAISLGNRTGAWAI